MNEDSALILFLLVVALAVAVMLARTIQPASEATVRVLTIGGDQVVIFRNGLHIAPVECSNGTRYILVYNGFNEPVRLAKLEYQSFAIYYDGTVKPLNERLRPLDPRHSIALHVTLRPGDYVLIPIKCEVPKPDETYARLFDVEVRVYYIKGGKLLDWRTGVLFEVR